MRLSSDLVSGSSIQTKSSKLSRSRLLLRLKHGDRTVKWEGNFSPPSARGGPRPQCEGNLSCWLWPNCVKALEEECYYYKRANDCFTEGSILPARSLHARMIDTDVDIIRGFARKNLGSVNIS